MAQFPGVPVIKDPDRSLRVVLSRGENERALLASATLHTDSVGRNIYSSGLSDLAHSWHASGESHTKYRGGDGQWHRTGEVHSSPTSAIDSPRLVAQTSRALVELDWRYRKQETANKAHVTAALEQLPSPFAVTLIHALRRDRREDFLTGFAFGSPECWEFRVAAQGELLDGETLLVAHVMVMTEVGERRMMTRLTEMAGIPAERNCCCPCGSGRKFKRCHGIGFRRYFPWGVNTVTVRSDGFLVVGTGNGIFFFDQQGAPPIDFTLSTQQLT